MAGCKKRGHLVLSQRCTEQKTLNFRTTEFAQTLILVNVLHAFGDYRKSEPVSHDDDRLNDHGVLSVRDHAGDEGTVNLDGINGQIPQIAERGVTRSKIIHGETDAEGAQFFDGFCSGDIITNDGTLRQFEYQGFGSDSAIPDGTPDSLGEVPASDLMRRNVDGHRTGREPFILPVTELAAGRKQDLVTKLVDQSVLFSERHEFIRFDPSKPGVIPANESLHPRDVSGRRRDLRLIMELDLTM